MASKLSSSAAGVGRWAHWKERLYQYALLVRLHKPIGIYLLLWPTLWALWIACEGMPSWHFLIVFTLGTTLMRSAGCAINDFADRKIDGHVRRTKDRPLATGKVTPKEAIGVMIALALISFLLVLTLNPLSIQLSFVALALAISYPFMKRITHWPQLVLGLAFGFGIPMAFAAQTNEVPMLAWALLGINVLWSIGYDTMYAMADREDDLKIGVKSTAILFGRYDVALVALFQGLVMLGLFLVGWSLQLSLWYYAGWLVACALVVRQIYRIRDREPMVCFAAFLNNHYVGFAIFAGLFLHYGIAT